LAERFEAILGGEERGSPQRHRDTERRGEEREEEVAEWRSGGVAEWRSGGVAEWRSGGVAE
jgi:hypothetical protein